MSKTTFIAETDITKEFLNAVNNHTHATGANDGCGALDSTAVQTIINAMGLALVPSGAIQPFARNSAPTGWLKCNGAAVSRTTYAALFTAIGTTFGSGDGSTTFNVPDLRGEFIRGWADDRSVDTGRVFGSTQADALKAHTHTIAWETGTTFDAGTNRTGLNTGGTTATSSTGNTETRPRNVALLYCIKV